jgi:hypothetical protein
MFTKLAQINVDHYNNHPTKHAALTAGMFVAVVVGANKIVKRIAKENPELRSGMYA